VPPIEKAQAIMVAALKLEGLPPTPFHPRRVFVGLQIWVSLVASVPNEDRRVLVQLALGLAFGGQPSARLSPERPLPNLQRDAEVGKQQVVILRLQKLVLDLRPAPQVRLLKPLI